jgi:hypothetical protein
MYLFSLQIKGDSNKKKKELIWCKHVSFPWLRIHCRLHLAFRTEVPLKGKLPQLLSVNIRESGINSGDARLQFLEGHMPSFSFPGFLVLESER